MICPYRLSLRGQPRRSSAALAVHWNSAIAHAPHTCGTSASATAAGCERLAPLRTLAEALKSALRLLVVVVSVALDRPEHADGHFLLLKLRARCDLPVWSNVGARSIMMAPTFHGARRVHRERCLGRPCCMLHVAPHAPVRCPDPPLRHRYQSAGEREGSSIGIPQWRAKFASNSLQ